MLYGLYSGAGAFLVLLRGPTADPARADHLAVPQDGHSPLSHDEASRHLYLQRAEHRPVGPGLQLSAGLAEDGRRDGLARLPSMASTRVPSIFCIVIRFVPESTTDTATLIPRSCAFDIASSQIFTASVSVNTAIVRPPQGVFDSARGERRR